MGKLGEQVLGWAALGLLAFGAYAGVSFVVDQVKSHSTVKASAPDPRDQQIKELTARIASLEGKAKIQHHYELRSEGARTFRFDPDTGETCIQLASKEDWKRPETTRQGCEYQDWVNTPGATEKDRLTAECYLVNSKPACNLLTQGDPK